jgi:hypothetical protein
MELGQVARRIRENQKPPNNHFLNPVEIENGKVRVIVEKNGKSVK